MGKSITPLNIDEDLKKEAKARFINMSEVANLALREKLNKKEVLIDESDLKCEFCGKDGFKETIDMLKKGIKNNSKLTWIYPDEKWICNSCLRHFSLKFSYGTNA